MGRRSLASSRRTFRNRQPGHTLPGLSYAQDVSHFHNVIQSVRTLDEAKKRKPEFEGMSPPLERPSTQDPPSSGTSP